MTTPTLSLHRKLAQVMYEAERIPKRGKAPAEMGGFQFVQVGDAADFIRKQLAEKVITMMPTKVTIVGQTEHATKAGGSMTTVDLITDWTLTDGESGESIVIQSFGAGADGGDKYSGKAQTNAMKYALLMGFLLSTGDDPELSDSSDRRPRTRTEPIETEPMTSADGGLIGNVVKGKSPVDMEVRQTPDGAAWGFKLAQGHKGYQALAHGPLAEALAMVGLEEGTRVIVWGEVEMVPWKKAGKPMPPFARIAVTKVQAPEWTLPGATSATEPPAEVKRGVLTGGQELAVLRGKADHLADDDESDDDELVEPDTIPLFGQQGQPE